jgi:ABC-type hemin transport system substrate-binding protein
MEVLLSSTIKSIKKNTVWAPSFPKKKKRNIKKTNHHKVTRWIGIPRDIRKTKNDQHAKKIKRREKKEKKKDHNKFLFVKKKKGGVKGKKRKKLENHLS